MKVSTDTDLFSLLPCSAPLCLHFSLQEDQIVGRVWRASIFLLRKWLRHCTHHFLGWIQIYTFPNSFSVGPVYDHQVCALAWPPVAWWFRASGWSSRIDQSFTLGKLGPLVHLEKFCTLNRWNLQVTSWVSLKHHFTSCILHFSLSSSQIPWIYNSPKSITTFIPDSGS